MLLETQNGTWIYCHYSCQFCFFLQSVENLKPIIIRLLDSSLWFTDVPLKKAKSSHPTQTQLDGRRTGQCHSTVYHLTYFTILSPLALLNTVWRVTFSRRMRKACNCKHPLAHTHRKISKYTHSSKVIAGNSQYEWWAFVFADTRQQRLWHGCMREINTRKALCYIWIGMHMHTCTHADRSLALIIEIKAGHFTRSWSPLCYMFMPSWCNGAFDSGPLLQQAKDRRKQSKNSHISCTGPHICAHTHTEKISLSELCACCSKILQRGTLSHTNTLSVSLGCERRRRWMVFSLGCSGSDEWPDNFQATHTNQHTHKHTH